MSPLQIGLFGFGCVGQGLYDTLASTQGLRASIRQICVKNPDKPRRLSPECFTYQPQDILSDEQIGLVVELIDDADQAYALITEAMRRGKNVVSANKKMLAEHLTELVQLQHQTGTSLLYEGAVCGSIPILRTLEEYYDTELLRSISGIFNGTTNYILTQMSQNGAVGYAQALQEAQEKGFAESDPTLDVDGFDAKYKVVIAAAHAFGVIVQPDHVLNYGIRTISPSDMQLAREKNLKIKLLAYAARLEQGMAALVLPAFIRPDNPLFNVEYEYNGVAVQAAFSEKQFFLGKGAGSLPTGAAVLSDVAANVHQYRYEYKKTHQNRSLKYTTDYSVELYLRYPDDQVLGAFPFTEITERHQEPGFQYVVGHIRMADLLALPPQVLRHPEVFIALATRGLPA